MSDNKHDSSQDIHHGAEASALHRQRTPSEYH